MSKCPFWSVKKESVSCYKGCPMRETDSQDEECPFVELLQQSKIVYKDIDNENFEYSEEKHREYDFLKKISSY